MEKHIRCRDCEYAKQDRNASDYTIKHCKSCDKWDSCPICFGCKKKDICKARQSRNNTQSCNRRSDTVCPKQDVVWAAYQCTNCDSEYHRALLNVSYNGDRQLRISWSGCECGEKIM
jgi:hypothetical protein